MNYNETIDYLYNAAPAFTKVGASAYKEGLENTIALDKHCGHPHRQFKCIHVAGTNGKGSCSHTIAAMLQAQGYKVGLYTSPHLVTFRERMRVNGVMASEEFVVDWVERHRSFFEQLSPSFFELTTAMAFCYFAEQNVDYAVIEVGLGGRLDCTNIISPILSVITNISFDHTQFLGDTLAKIAAEKAGIIKEGVPVVIGETNAETRSVFVRTAEAKHAPIIFAEEQAYDLPPFQLKGYYQKANARTIMTVAQILVERDILSAEAISEGFAHVCDLTGLQGRWQRLSDKPVVVCDTGHNVAGWEYLAEQIRTESKGRTLRMVFGMVDDKDLATVLRMLPTDAIYYFTQASTHRAIPAEKVKEKAIEANLIPNGSCADVYPCVADAFKAALSDASENDFIFVGGSSYVVADLLTNYQL